ncbi:MAG: isocitrate lyase/PEP mutase family protein [Halieaceae bacterium]
MHRKQLSALLQQGTTLSAPGVYDGLSSLLVEQAGFELCFFSGGAYSFARYGKPDLGLISMQEIADAVAIIRERISLPMIVDMDTGFGNALNVQRTVKVFERSGASALQMEDQVMPKRCGHMAGKDVVSINEMVGKIKAFTDARVDENTLLVARTDALAVNGFEDALDRAEHYLAAGADLLFIEAPQSLQQMQAISARFAQRIPLVHNLVEGGNSPVTDTSALAGLNYRVALFPVSLLHQHIPMSQQLLAHLRAQGSSANYTGSLIDLAETNRLLGVEALLEDSEKFTT